MKFAIKKVHGARTRRAGGKRKGEERERERSEKERENERERLEGENEIEKREREREREGEEKRESKKPQFEKIMTYQNSTALLILQIFFFSLSPHLFPFPSHGACNLFCSRCLFQLIYFTPRRRRRLRALSRQRRRRCPVCPTEKTQSSPRP